MELTIEQRQGNAVMRMNGSLNASTVNTVRKQISQWLSDYNSINRWILDASSLEFIDSAGLGMLIGTMQGIVARGGTFSIAGMKKHTRLVLSMTRSQHLFTLFNDLQDACMQ